MSNELALQIVLGFALGSNLLVREIDDGTLNFLDGLPLTRGAIFVAKIKAAMLVLMILPVGLLLLNVALHLATRGSLDYALRPALLLTFFGLSVLVTAVSLTAGMLLGFLRSCPGWCWRCARSASSCWRTRRRPGGRPEHGRPADLAFHRNGLATAVADDLDPARCGAAVRVAAFSVHRRGACWRA